MNILRSDDHYAYRVFQSLLKPHGMFRYIILNCAPCSNFLKRKQNSFTKFPELGTLE
jgi:hypothetical protein